MLFSSKIPASSESSGVEGFRVEGGMLGKTVARVEMCHVGQLCSHKQYCLHLLLRWDGILPYYFSVNYTI